MNLSAAVLDRILEHYERMHSPRAVGLAAGWIRRSFRRGPGTGTMHAVQERRLQRTIEYAARRSPFYRAMFRRHGLSPGDVRTGSDLRRLPFTTADDLRDWRQFLCVPPEQLVALYTSSGTSGEPKRVYFTQNDARAMSNLSAATLRAGHPGRLVALIALPMRHGLWIGWQTAMQIVQRAGGMALPVGADDLAVTLHWMQRTQPTVIFSSPSYLTALTQLAEQTGYRARVDAIWVGGEPLTSAQRDRLASYWQAGVTDTYGMTEIGGAQSFRRTGCRAFHLNDPLLFTEIVDPETGQPALQGELVFTTLQREGMPLIRYRSGDLGTYANCDCRIPLTAIQVLGRADDMMILSGVHMYASTIASAIGPVAGTDGRIQIRLDRVGLFDRVVLRVGGRGVSEDSVRAALYAAYPEMPDRVSNGTLLLEIETDAELGNQVKNVVVTDRR